MSEELKTQELITPERVKISLRSRYNPLRGLNPDVLVNHLEQFRMGLFRAAAMDWDAIERRDCLVKVVTGKRKKSVSRHGWEILMKDDSGEAEHQKELLEGFYNRLTATSVLEPDESGGVSLLIRQMMDAVGKRYSVHEVVWKPDAKGLGASFRHCPLWWFEGTQGRLRFLQSELAATGVDMEPGAWLVSCGEGLMEATSLAYVLRLLSIKDWLAASEKFGMPGILGKTDATPGSAEWTAMVNALADFSSNWAAVVNNTASIELVESGTGAGAGPFQPLVEMMDRAITTLWRGGDLSTISKENSVGSSVQADEGDILLEDDAQWISETLQAQVSRRVLAYHFGEGVEELAYIKVKTPRKKDIQTDLQVDQFLLKSGAKLGLRDAMERYTRTMPDGDEEILGAPASSDSAATSKLGVGKLKEEGGDMANAAVVTAAADGAVDPTEELRGRSLRGLAEAQARVLEPLRDRLVGIVELSDNPKAFAVALAKLRADLPTLLKEMNASQETVRVIEAAIGAAAVNGLATGETDSHVD